MIRGLSSSGVAQILTDGRRIWTNTGKIEPTAEANLLMKTPFLVNQKFLQIKLRDFPNTEGLTVTNFLYSNRVKKTNGKETVSNRQFNQLIQPEIKVSINRQ